MSANLRPDHLTIELVVENYERLLRHRIRQFKVREPVEDCLQQILLNMITPSETLGTSYLQRYNPSRGPAQHYVLMFTMQHMMKLHAREKKRSMIMPEPIALVFEDAEELLEAPDMVAESTIADPSWDSDEVHATIRTPEDLRRFLAGTRHIKATSMSPSGEPRSTCYMLELLLWGGLTVVEIAQRLDLGTAEIYRRFKALQKEPRILPLLRTRGFTAA